MDDYISREVLVAHFRRLATEARAEYEEFGDEAGTIADTFFDAATVIKNFPAADVEPVRHGRWINKKGGFWEVAQCSECGEWQPTTGASGKRCNNCGAKMDLEAADEQS